MKTKFKILSIFVFLSLGLAAQHDVIQNIAGLPGLPGYTGEGTVATESQLNAPLSIAKDSEGNLYWTQLFTHRIMKLEMSTGLLSTYLGDGSPASSPSGTPRVDASIAYPGALCFDADDNLYWTEAGAPCAIKVLHKDDDKIYHLVGDGGTSYSDSGYKGHLTGIGAPYGVAVDGGGNVYWTERTGYCIRKWNPVDSIVSLIAGIPTVSGTENTTVPADSTPLTIKGGISVTPDGNFIYFSSDNSHNVYEIYWDGPDRRLRRIAGTTSEGAGPLVGVATSTALSEPFGVKIAPDGSIFFGELGNGLVRRVDLSTGAITTLAGVQNEVAYNGDYLAPLLTKMGVVDIEFGDDDGEFYITDNENHLIRKKYTCYNPEPYAIGISPDSYCTGDTVYFEVDGDLNNGSQWYWQGENCGILQPVLDSGNTFWTIASPNDEVFHVQGRGRCTFDEPCLSVTVQSLCDDYSNAFTPNGDGINDYFDLEIVKDFPSNNLYVYNRYGEEVFFTQDYNNDDVVWDGSSDYTGGVVVPGTYYFVLYDVTSNTDVLSGWVEVIK